MQIPKFKQTTFTLHRDTYSRRPMDTRPRDCVYSVYVSFGTHDAEINMSAFQQIARTIRERLQASVVWNNMEQTVQMIKDCTDHLMKYDFIVTNIEITNLNYETFYKHVDERFKEQDLSKTNKGVAKEEWVAVLASGQTL